MRATRDAARPASARVGRSSSSPAAARLGSLATLSRTDVLALQRDAGNQAVQRLVGGMLQVGSRGPEVVKLQQALGLKADGAFGPQTKAAVVAFQRRNGLTPDGIVGPKTWGALEGGGPAGGGAAAKPQGEAAKLRVLHELLGKIRAHLVAPPSPVGGGQELTVTPEPRTGWYDDATDWVEDTAGAAVDTAAGVASDVGGWVEDKAGAAADWAGDMASEAYDTAAGVASDVGGWVEDKAGAAADWAGEQAGAAADWVGEQAGAAGDWLEEKADEAATIADDIAEGIGDLADDFVESLPTPVKQFIGMLTDIVTGGGLHGPALDDLITKAAAAYAGLSGAAADELKAGGGGATLDFKKSTNTNDANFTFNDATFPSLQATLTARTDEIGNATPQLGTLMINGKDGTALPDDEKVTSVQLSVVENITLPKWTNEGSASVQDAERAEWKRYVGEVSAHEDLHATDDEGIYKAALTSMIGMKVKDAFAALDAATEKGNKQGPARDGTNPPPKLMPRGTTKVP